MDAKLFARKVLPVLVLIGCVGGIIYTQPQLWGGLSPAPTVDTLTGTWRSSVSGHGLTAWWLEDSNQKFFYDVELRLTQSGNTITGSITETMKSSQAFGTNLPPELAGLLNVPVTSQITDGRIEINKIQFKAGDIQWSGTFLTDSMKGTIQENVDNTVTPPGVERVDKGWVGEFNLYREW